MSRVRKILATTASLGVLALAAPTLAHPETSSTEEVREIEIIKSDKAGGEHGRHAALAADCAKGRKFESSSEAGDSAKEKRVSKMVICSEPGESDEAWAKTLRDVLARVQGDDDMTAEGKAKIVADLQSEIAKIGK